MCCIHYFSALVNFDLNCLEQIIIMSDEQFRLLIFRRHRLTTSTINYKSTKQCLLSTQNLINRNHRNRNKNSIFSKDFNNEKHWSKTCCRCSGSLVWNRGKQATATKVHVFVACCSRCESGFNSIIRQFIGSSINRSFYHFDYSVILHFDFSIIWSLRSFRIQSGPEKIL